MRRHLVLSLGLLLAAAAAAGQAPIHPSRGADPRVDYRSLTRFGPWDDRNYDLTAEDLALLPAWEAERREPLPAFFRVELHRTWPGLAKARLPYPRSALNVFLQRYGGFRVEGRLYQRVERVGDRLQVVLEGGVPAPPGGGDPTAAAERAGASLALDGEVRVTSPVGAAESAVAINPADPSVVIAGTNGHVPGAGQKMYYSTDGGESWTQAADLPLGGTCCDPTVEWSADGSLAYAATLGGFRVWFYRSSDNGQTWDDLASIPPGDPRREITSSGSDKEYLHVDRSAASPHRDNVYLTWHGGNASFPFNVMKFSRSTDLGNTWSAPIDVSADDELGIGSDIVTDAAGNIHYVWPTFGSAEDIPPVDGRILVARSTDGGATFGAATQIAATQGEYEFPIPSMDTRRVFIYVAAAVDLSGGDYADRLYVAWTDSTGPTDPEAPASNHARIQVAWSDDGAAWTVVTPHETDDLESVDRWHPWIAVGSDGIVHVAFYDTRRDPTRASVDFFYTRSLDGGQTWLPPRRLTGVQSPGLTDTFQFGDYNGLDVVMADMVAVFTDNRDEVGGGGDSRDVYAAGILECAAATDLVLTSSPPVSGIEQKVACNTITAGTDYFVQGPSGALTLRAGRQVSFVAGFKVERDGQLIVDIEPYLETLP